MWRLLTHPGTFHALVQAVVTAATGGGWSFQWPEWAAAAAPSGASSGAVSALGGSADADASVSTSSGPPPKDATYYGAHPDANWDRVISAERELAFFKRRAIDDAAIDAADSANTSPWELMMDKDLPGKLKYTAWRRTLPDGKTEYKSVTIAPDAQPEEIMDLFLDDDFRRTEYDGMLTHTSVLETGDFSRRQQVVRWVRRFPFAFLSDREYAIGRCLVREPAEALALSPRDRPTRSREVLYGLTRAVRHPREDRRSRVVRMDVFWSHWRSRGVPCPWGSSQMACETILLHHEQFKIPENLARFAVRHGMWGFVRSLSTKTAQFVAARRERVAADARDPRAYGFGVPANPPTAEEVARAEAEEEAMAAGSGGGKAASRQASAQLPPLAGPAPDLASAGAGPETPPSTQPTPQMHMARSSSQAFSVASSSFGSSEAEGGGGSGGGATTAAAADPAFLPWAHSGPVVARLRTALPSLPPNSGVAIHHSLSNASVAGLATVPSMVWSKIARAGSFGGGKLSSSLAALAGAAGGGSGGGAAAPADADGNDSVLDFCDGEDDDDARRGDQAAAPPPPRTVSFAGGKAGEAAAPVEAERRRQQQQQRKEHEEEQQRRRVRRAAAAVLAAGALALAVGGARGPAATDGDDGEQQRRRRRRVVVAALPSPAEEQRRRRERQLQHRELRSCDEEHRARAAAAEKQEQQQRHQRRKGGGGASAPSPRSYPPLLSL